MKPLLIALLLTLCACADAQFIKFKCYQSANFGPHEYAKNVQEYRYTNVDILITVDLHAHQVKTYGQEKGEYSLIKILSSEKPDNGDMYVKYEAVDEKGDDCTVSITSFADKTLDNVADIVIRYKSIGLIFRLKSYN